MQHVNTVSYYYFLFAVETLLPQSMQQFQTVHKNLQEQKDLQQNL